MPSTSEEGRTCWRMRASSVEERITGPMKPSDSRVEGVEPDRAGRCSLECFCDSVVDYRSPNTTRSAFSF